jgi:hypothetical protein
MKPPQPKNPPEAQFYEAMAKIEKYEAMMFEALQALGYGRYVPNLERARDLLRKALSDTRYAEKIPG